MARAVSVLVAMAFALALPLSSAYAIKVGQTVSSVQVRDSNDKPASIPDIGKKVVVVFYTDPDAKDENEPLREYMKSQNLDDKKLRTLGVVNLKDSWKPNFLIRKIVRGKVKKYGKLILTDKDHTLKKKWNLGTTNGKDIVVVIGKDKKIKYFTRSSLKKDKQKKVVDYIKKLMEK